MKLTVEDLADMKVRGEKIVSLTCYDYPTARFQDKAGVDMLLVGDSVGTNVLGYSRIQDVSIDDMIHHCGAVARGAQRAFVLADMPFGSYDTDSDAFNNAKRLVGAGAQAVKLEGARETVSRIRHLVGRGIAVCGHIGYTPQTVTGKPSMYGKDQESSRMLLDEALSIESAGACMIVLELIHEKVAHEITATVGIPTIGIGAGPLCDGQVQVVVDIMGLSEKIYRHSCAYMDGGSMLSTAFSHYVQDVKSGAFPPANRSDMPGGQKERDSGGSGS